MNSGSATRKEEKLLTDTRLQIPAVASSLTSNAIDWDKYKLDGTAHIDERNKSNNNTQLAELTKQVSGLREAVNILISQIQALKSEVKQKK